MNVNLFRTVFLVFFLGLAILPGPAKSFAQDESVSDEKAREDDTQEMLNQIHDLQLKMQDNAKRLDALEKAVNQTDTDETAVGSASNSSAQEVPIEPVAKQEIAPVAAQPSSTGQDSTPEAPIRLSPTQVYSEDQAVEHKAQLTNPPLPSAPIYYAPLISFPKEHTFELGQEDFYSTHKEIGNNKNGVFYGINSAYTFQPLDAENWPINVFHIDVHGDYGVFDYNDGQGDKLKRINNYIIEPRTWLGKNFDLGSNDHLTPYVGFGYRWYYEDLKNKITDDEQIDGLNFQIQSNNTQTQYLYVPLGAQLSVSLFDGWRIDMNSEYDFLVWGRVTNYAPNFSVDSTKIYSPAVNNTLRNGYGIRGSIKIIKEEDSLNYFVEPYVRYWNIRSSNTVSDPFSIDGVPIGSISIQQEKNHTTEIGARVGIEF